MQFIANNKKRNAGRVPSDLLLLALMLLERQRTASAQLATKQLRTRYAEQLGSRAHAG